MARGFDRVHDMKVKIIRVRIVRDELRYLDSSDKILVRVGHEIIMSRLVHIHIISSAQKKGDEEKENNAHHGSDLGRFTLSLLFHHLVLSYSHFYIPNQFLARLSLL